MSQKKESYNSIPMAPTIMVLFGITGDLAKRKVLPALFDLYVQGRLPVNFALIGFSRRDLSEKDMDNDDGIRTYVKGVIAAKGHKHKKKDVHAFLQMVHYQPGNFTDAAAYGDLAEHLIRIEDRFGQCTNKLFHLAVPPKYYSQLFTHLSQTGLTIPCSNETGWARVLVEKPFGSDIETAKKLDRELSFLFKEEQIFRIDHYLGKEMLQDIMMFRFANSIFEPVWNHNYIERVEITINEDIDVTDRGAFYDGVGALRDVGQNHALQMLALIAMERPKAFEAGTIRQARASALARLRPLSKKEVATKTVRAQYNGFKDVEGVLSGSETETFFRVSLCSDSPRWTGVPFILQGGKALQEKRTEIRIIFKEAMSFAGQTQCRNELTFCLQPCQEIRMTFASKRPGFTYEIQEEDFIFSEMNRADADAPDAYEKVLFDCIHGDQTMFTSSDEVVSAWRVITPIVNAWKKDVTPLRMYEKGRHPNDIM